ncbi:MAG TPA: energy transducer TonB [Rhodanobacter sp.]|jgi:TonB family protein
MRHLKILALLAISTACFGQTPQAGNTTASDAARMTPEQQRQQFRCEQTREQIKGQLNRKVMGPSDRENLASLRKNERIDCVPPLVSPPPSAASLPAKYPVQAVRQNHQGVVIVRVELAADGSVTDDSVYQSSGFQELDRSALATVRSWHFDTSLGTSLRVPVRFSLAN